MLFCSDDVRQSRLNICDACPEKSGNKCLACGCNIEYKTRLSVTKCPLNKWQKDGEIKMPWQIMLENMRDKK